MNVPVIAFFNNKGGVGKTSMVYHLSWMFANLGVNVIAADLDPQSNLTAAFLDEDRLEELMADGNNHQSTIFGAINPLKRGVGDIDEPFIEKITDRLGLVLGDMALSTFEDQLSEVWPKCNDGDERSFRVISSLWRTVQNAASNHEAALILVDLGPNLGAINRAALIASDYVVIPLCPDLFSLQGLQNLGPAIRAWRKEWKERLGKNPARDLDLPAGSIMPIGYILQRHAIRLDRPVKAFDRWIARMPSIYSESVLQQPINPSTTIDTDPHCIAQLRDYRSLMPLAQESRKPMFFLKSADGALGAHIHSVARVYEDFKSMAKKIAARVQVKLNDR